VFDSVVAMVVALRESCELGELGRSVRPLVLARDRSVALTGALGAVVPGAAVVRGSVLRVEGAAGTGATTLGFELAAAFTAVGEWAAAVDLQGTLGARAAGEAGVTLERFAVVRRVPPARWATVVAALLDGVSVVLAEVPRHVSTGDARRLVARARERSAVLVVGGGPWLAGVAFTLHAEGSVWSGLTDDGMLTHRRLQVRVDGRGEAARARTGELVSLARAV
jgi:hypothetical protein